jgi:hypothetical protein
VIFGVVRLIEEINSVRNPATHAEVEPSEIKKMTINCWLVLDAIKKE